MVLIAASDGGGQNKVMETAGAKAVQDTASPAASNMPP